MSEKKIIKRALISVYHKDGLDYILELLHKYGVEIISTGGTERYIREKGYPCTAVEDFTSYPSIFGGRVKTLHPSIMGGILARRGVEEDERQCEMYQIPYLDLVIVDLYPFVETLRTGASHQEIIEKIDIGGVSLIRAASKNYKDVVVCPSRSQYGKLEALLRRGAESTLQERLSFAADGLKVTSLYDTAISQYLNTQSVAIDSSSNHVETTHEDVVLRYGENPHQEAIYRGDVSRFVQQIHGKDISYNNLLDINSAIALMQEFGQEKACFAILKHNNPCGLAYGEDIREAYLKALAADPLSAFGGILIANREINISAAKEINKLFCEVLIAPDFSAEALDLLKSKKNRIILKWNISEELPKKEERSCLGGSLVQDRDISNETYEDCKWVTHKRASNQQIDDLIFANRIVKHCKSNAIVLVKDSQLLAAGVGQPSRIDSLHQAIDKARRFEFDLEGAVLASDAFFPFSDCVEAAHEAGIVAIIQPGGSIRDEESIKACEERNMSMCFTGIRHFRH